MKLNKLFVLIAATMISSQTFAAKCGGIEFGKNSYCVENLEKTGNSVSLSNDEENGVTVTYIRGGKVVSSATGLGEEYGSLNYNKVPSPFKVLTVSETKQVLVLRANGDRTSSVIFYALNEQDMTRLKVLEGSDSRRMIVAAFPGIVNVSEKKVEIIDSKYVAEYAISGSEIKQISYKVK